MDEPITFGAALRAQRKDAGLTQAELAQRIGTSQQNVAGWEAGRALPRQDLFEALVAFFGNRSPLAALPPRGTLPWHRATPEYTVSTESFSDQDVPSFSRRQADAPAPAPAFSRPRPPEGVAGWIGPRERHTNRMRDALPEDLRGNVEVEVAPRYRADYWSEKLGLELKVTTEALLLRVARDGMQHLLALKAKAERSGGRAPKHLVVAIAVPTLTNTVRQLARATEEADLLGIELLMCAGIDDAAAAIVAYESGQLPMAEDEDWGAF